jgi:hypothetical protein
LVETRKASAESGGNNSGEFAWVRKKADKGKNIEFSIFSGNGRKVPNPARGN